MSIIKLPVKVPFSESQLADASLPDLDGFDRKILAELGKDMFDFFPMDDTEVINRKMAEKHGVSIETLLRNPDLSNLRKNYLKEVILRFIEIAQTKLNFTELQAWSLLYPLIKI